MSGVTLSAACHDGLHLHCEISPKAGGSCECRCHAEKAAADAGKSGIKFDWGKAKWSLVPWGPMQVVADIMTMGARKYGPNNWQQVENGRERYADAAMRHFIAWQCGERDDPESGRHHLAHAVCCLLFLVWLDMNGKKARVRK